MLEFHKLPNHNHLIPPGEYVITDPCYVMPRNMWSDLCAKIFCDKTNENYNGFFEIDGFVIWWGCTQYGDGSYEVKQSMGRDSLGQFGVDAGLYAIIPMGFVKKHCKDNKDLQEGIAVKAKFGGKVYYLDGNMRCGSIYVDTGFDSDEESDETDY